MNIRERDAERHEAAPTTESLGSQVCRLAQFIVEHIPGEPSCSEGAIDTAIRLLADRDARLARVAKVLDQRFSTGSRVTNCVSHMGMPFDDRPDDCRLCRTDVTNHLAFAVRVNDWLNARLDEARAALADAGAGKERG